jgi:iron uptake system EfeUOB component EfeO/EfeM
MRNFLTLAVVVTLLSSVANLQAQTRDTFEVSSLKAVRPTLEKTIAALEKKDITGAKAAFEAYDAAWNGVEVYINRRYIDRYNEIEHGFQDRITKGLQSATPDAAALAADAKAMLAKYDETVAMIAKAQPLSPLYDDVARMRITRAPLRDVAPALKAGDVAKARASFLEFHNRWEPMEPLVEKRSHEKFELIENAVHNIMGTFQQDKPNMEQLTKMVNEMSLNYNLVLAELAKEAQATK